MHLPYGNPKFSANCQRFNQSLKQPIVRNAYLIKWIKSIGWTLRDQALA